MLPMPWKGFHEPQEGKEYVAMLSLLPLKSYWKIPRFVQFTFATQRQLKNARGLIGYSLCADLLRKRFYTLSVWEDRQALMDFVEEIPHGEIMQKLKPHMGESRFVEWKARAAEIPIQWKGALKRAA
jgi:heme-degrading monooxygenase HmoA